jgi:hypothetical protein
MKGLCSQQGGRFYKTVTANQKNSVGALMEEPNNCGNKAPSLVWTHFAQCPDRFF